MGWFGHVSTGGHGRQLHTSNTAWSYGSSGNIGRSISTGCSSSFISSFSISSVCNGRSSSSNNSSSS